jgi:guanylate kinase
MWVTLTQFLVIRISSYFTQLLGGIMVTLLSQLTLPEGETVDSLLQKSDLLGIVGPSDVGKNSMIGEMHFIASNAFRFVTSVTTRPPRPKEIDGTHYHFISREQFEQLIVQNELIEYAESFGNLYGTLKSEILLATLAGKVAMIDVEINGATELQKFFTNRFKGVLLYPKSKAELKTRLLLRRSETEAQIDRRLDKAFDEIVGALNLGCYPICNPEGGLQNAALEVIRYAHIRLNEDYSVNSDKVG